MTILNPFLCENCEEELQPKNIKVGIDEEGNLIRICGFCGNKVKI